METVVSTASESVDLARHVDEAGAELKRGALLNTVALLTSNLRGIFTFLVARLLGPSALGIFSVAWATTDLLSKVGIFGLDDAITTFIARANAVGDQARARALFRLAIGLAVAFSTVHCLGFDRRTPSAARAFTSGAANGFGALGASLCDSGNCIVSHQHFGFARDEGDAT